MSHTFIKSKMAELKGWLQATSTQAGSRDRELFTLTRDNPVHGNLYSDVSSLGKAVSLPC